MEETSRLPPRGPLRRSAWPCAAVPLGGQRRPGRAGFFADGGVGTQLCADVRCCAAQDRIRHGEYPLPSRWPNLIDHIVGREGFEPTQRVALGLQPSPTLQRRRRPESLDSALRFSATGRTVGDGDIALPARRPPSALRKSPVSLCRTGPPLPTHFRLLQGSDVIAPSMNSPRCTRGEFRGSPVG